MSAHTKGPWTFGTGSRGRFGAQTLEVTAVTNGLPQVVAIVTRIQSGEANARLISAAPDLLEALQMVRDYVVTLKGAGHDYQVTIDAAILKATGEQA